MKNQNLNFGKNFYANVEIKDLERLGWDFYPTYEDVAKAKNISEEEAKAWENENYHVQIKVDNEGYTSFRTVNTSRADNKIDEGSGYEDTGDDEKTTEDLCTLYNESKLWNEGNFIG